VEQLFRIIRGTISRHTIHGVKNLTAVTANVLLMKTSPIPIVRSDINHNFPCPLLDYLYCLQMLTYLRQYNNTVYSHAHIYNSVCSNNWSLSCKCVPIGTTAQHHSAQNTADNTNLRTLPRHTKIWVSKIPVNSIKKPKLSHRMSWYHMIQILGRFAMRSFQYRHTDNRKQ